jgi:2-phospho-L-lactate guanylyltransferase
VKLAVVIPCQGFGRGKSRLAPVLGPEERRAFSRRSFRNVLRAARLSAGARNVIVASRSADVLGLARRAGATALIEKRPALNPTVEAAVALARARGARTVIVVHADLPELIARDLRDVATRARPLALAPDRLSSGTNAVGVTRHARFRFHFGAGSFARHRAEARARRLRARVVVTSGLSGDVDTPDDYARFVRGA